MQLLMMSAAACAALAGCLGSTGAASGGRSYRVVAVAWEARPVPARRAAGGCTLQAGAQAGRFWPGRATGAFPGGVPVLTASERELLSGLALRCDGWSAPPPLGIKGPARRSTPIPDRTEERVLLRSLSPRDLAAGAVTIDGEAPAGWGAPRPRVRLRLRLEPLSPL